MTDFEEIVRDGREVGSDLDETRGRHNTSGLMLSVLHLLGGDTYDQTTATTTNNINKSQDIAERCRLEESGLQNMRK